MKTPAQRLVVAGELEVGLEARDLPPVGVARDLEVEHAEVVAVEQDHPGARAEHRPGELAERVLEPVEADEPHDRGRLAARDHEPVEPFELLRLAHLDRLHAQPPQHRLVLAEVPLNRQNADLHALEL